MIATLLTAALLCSPQLSDQHDTRPLRIRVLLPNGEAVAPTTPGFVLGAIIALDDKQGTPVEFPTWHRTFQAEALDYRVPIGGCLRVAAYLPPYPVAELSLVATPCSGPQVHEIQLERPVPVRRLSIDLKFPGAAPPEWQEYVWELRSLETRVPVVQGLLTQETNHFGVPAGQYQLVINGQVPMMCGNSPPFPSEFAPYRRWLDLRAEDQAIEAQLVHGAGLKLLVQGEGPQIVKPQGSGWPYPSPTYLGDGIGDPSWVRPKLVNVNTDAEVPIGWGWSSLAFPMPQAGIPTQLQVFAVDRLHPGTYDLSILGHGTRPVVQRIVVQDGEEHTIQLVTRPR